MSFKILQKILSKEQKIKNKGLYKRVRHIYRICGVPIFFRDDKISYEREIYLDYIAKKERNLLFKKKHTNHITHSLGEYIVKTPNILEKIQNLLSGVEPKYADNILLIIRRLSDLYKYKAEDLYINSKDEIKAMRKMYDDFYGRIVEINKDSFVYAGYFLPINHFESSVFYHKHGLHILESSTLQKMRQRDFIDAGGFVGDSAILFEREFCDKKIHTFEATKHFYGLMLRTLELNKTSRIVPVNKGLGSKNEQLEIVVDGLGSTFNEQLKAKSKSEIKEIAEIITLDSYVAAHNIDVGFIKVDIEGFEQEFLKGAFETISRCKPAMLISIYHNASDFFDIKPMIESWNLGYTFKFYKPIDFGINGETALFCEVL